MLQMLQQQGMCPSFRPPHLEVIEGNHLGLDEAALKISVDHTRTLYEESVGDGKYKVTLKPNPTYIPFQPYPLYPPPIHLGTIVFPPPLPPAPPPTHPPGVRGSP